MYKILIVEDEINAREGLKRLIESKKEMYTICTANDGLDGLNTAQNFLPDIIISDIKMPKLDGLEMIRRLREFNLKAEFLILSGYAEFKYAQSALSLGVNNYILKPIVPFKVFSLLDKCIENIEKNKKTITPFHRENYSLASETQNQRLSVFYETVDATQLFFAVLFISSPNQIPLEWKSSVLENPNVTLLSFSDKRFVGMIAPTSCSSFHSLFSKLQILTKKDPSIVCTHTYHHNFKDKPFNWFANFKKLISCIPWSISLKKNFFQLERSMLEEQKNTLNDHEFRKSLNKLFYKGDYSSCSTLIINHLRELREKNYHPKEIITLAASYLFKIRTDTVEQPLNSCSELHFIQTVNKIMSVHTFWELEKIIGAYYTQGNSIKDTHVYSKPVLIAINEIKNNYQKPLTLNSTARKIGVTPQYLSRLFAKETTENFINHLTNYRMKKAEYFLQSTDLKIYEIAAQVGYSDAKYFCTVFKKIVGISPNRYRNDKNIL